MGETIGERIGLTMRKSTNGFISARKKGPKPSDDFKKFKGL